MEENTSKKSEAQKGEVLAPNHTADKRQRGLSLRPWPFCLHNVPGDTCHSFTRLGSRPVFLLRRNTTKSSAFWVAFEIASIVVSPQRPKVSDGPCSPSTISNFTTISFLSGFSQLLSDKFHLSTYFTSHITCYMCTQEIIHIWQALGMHLPLGMPLAPRLKKKNYFLCTLPFTWIISTVQYKENNGTNSRSLKSSQRCSKARSSWVPCGGHFELQEILTASGHSSSSGNTDLQLRQRSPLYCLLMTPHPGITRQKTNRKLAIWKLSEVWARWNITRWMITKMEAFESARPAPQHQLIINLVLPVIWTHVYFTKSYFKTAILPLPYTTPWHNLGKVLFAWQVQFFTTTN